MTRTLQELGTVVERIHLDVSAPSARQGFQPGATRQEAVAGRRHVTIESPRVQPPRRAAPASFHAIHVAGPWRLWTSGRVCNRSIERYGQRRRGRAQRTLQESGTVVEGIHLDVNAPSARLSAFQDTLTKINLLI